jgi:hypothetical protein
MAQQELLGNRTEAGKAFINEAAALEQTDELLARKDDNADKEEAQMPDATAAATATHEGPSVTYHLRSRLTIPSRNDQQLIEVARIETKPSYYYKAVPVLTSHIYRLADLANSSEYVLLPGEATMYVGSDFVGRMNLPLVAIGVQTRVRPRRGHCQFQDQAMRSISERLVKQGGYRLKTDGFDQLMIEPCLFRASWKRRLIVGGDGYDQDGFQIWLFPHRLGDLKPIQPR